MTDTTLFTVPHDDARAAELALRDAQRARMAWSCHAVARRRTDREHLAATAKLLEARIVQTADELIDRAARRFADV